MIQVHPSSLRFTSAHLGSPQFNQFNSGSPRFTPGHPGSSKFNQVYLSLLMFTSAHRSSPQLTQVHLSSSRLLTAHPGSHGKCLLNWSVCVGVHVVNSHSLWSAVISTGMPLSTTLRKATTTLLLRYLTTRSVLLFTFRSVDVGWGHDEVGMLGRPWSTKFSTGSSFHLAWLTSL